MIPKPVFSGIPVITCAELPLTCHDLDNGDEWTCLYCGRIHPASHDHCWDGVNGCGASRSEEPEIPQVPTILVPGVETTMPSRVYCDTESVCWTEIPICLTENGCDPLRAQLGQLFLPAMTRVVEAISAWIR